MIHKDDKREVSVSKKSNFLGENNKKDKLTKKGVQAPTKKKFYNRIISRCVFC